MRSELAAVVTTIEGGRLRTVRATFSVIDIARPGPTPPPPSSAPMRAGRCHIFETGGGEHPLNFSVLGMTDCEAAGAGVGGTPRGRSSTCAQRDGQLSHSHVPETPFPLWSETSNVDSYF